MNKELNIISHTDLMEGDHILVPSNSRFRTYIVKRPIVHNGRTYKTVKLSYKGNLVKNNYSWYILEEQSFENHNMNKSISLAYRDIFLYRRNHEKV